MHNGKVVAKEFLVPNYKLHFVFNELLKRFPWKGLSMMIISCSIRLLACVVTKDTVQLERGHCAWGRECGGGGLKDMLLSRNKLLQSPPFSLSL